MNLLKKLRDKFPGQPGNAVRPRRRSWLCLESLETRLTPAVNTFVVPVSELADGVHTFHSLAQAIVGAGTNGVVTVEPESSTDLDQPIVITTSSLTIQGDPNTPAASLPSYQLTVLAHKVTLHNLNLRGVSIGTSTDPNDAGYFGNTISNCLVGGVNDFGSASTLTQSTFTAGVTITNNNQNQQVDIIQNNLFTSTDRELLKVIFGFGAQITGNEFFGDSTEFAIDLEDCNGDPPGPTLVANNSIHLTGNQFSDNVGILVNQIGAGLLSFVEIDDNSIATQGLGIGIKIDRKSVV